MKNHPITAGIALATMLGGLAALTVWQMTERPSSNGHGDQGASSNGHSSHRGSPPSKEEASASREPANNKEARELVRQIRQAVQMGKAGDLAQAEAALKLLTEQHPNEVLVWMNYGVALSGQEQYDDALTAFERVLSIRPETWAAYAEIATIHLLRNDHDLALRVLEQIPPGKGRLAERLFRDPVWKGVDDPRFEELQEKHGGAPETSLHIDDVTARP